MPPARRRPTQQRKGADEWCWTWSSRRGMRWRNLLKHKVRACGTRMKITNPLNSFSPLCRRAPPAKSGFAQEEMTMLCPRCGTSRRPIGPRWSLDGWARPCVRFACSECGYSWNEVAGDRQMMAAYLPNEMSVSNSPPTAQTATATSGGARQAVRRTKPISATATSPGVLTDVVHTGL